MITNFIKSKADFQEMILEQRASVDQRALQVSGNIERPLAHE